MLTTETLLDAALFNRIVTRLIRTGVTTPNGLEYERAEIEHVRIEREFIVQLRATAKRKGDPGFIIRR